MKLLNSKLALIAVISTVLHVSLPAFAQDGGNAGGGGNATGNQLFDFAERGTPIDIRSLSFYPNVAQVLETLNDASPQFKLALSAAIERSKWTLDKNPLRTAGCIDKSLSGISKTVVACQNQLEIRLYQPWLYNPKVSARDKAALIIHEAVRRMGYVDPFVTQVTRDIFDLQSGQLSPGEFVKSINGYAGYGVGNFSSKADSCGAIDLMKTTVLNYPRTFNFSADDQIGSRFANAWLNDMVLVVRMQTIASHSIETSSSTDVTEKVAFGLQIINQTQTLYGCQ